MKPTADTDFKTDLITRLKDDAYAVGYLMVAIEDALETNSFDVIRLAFSDVQLAMEQKDIERDKENLKAAIAMVNAVKAKGGIRNDTMEQKEDKPRPMPHIFPEDTVVVVLKGVRQEGRVFKVSFDFEEGIFAGVVVQVAGERIVYAIPSEIQEIRRNGKTIWRCQEDEEDLDAAMDALAEAKEKGTVSLKKIGGLFEGE